MKNKSRLLRMEAPDPNQRMLFLAALTWCAVLGLDPPAWPPWAALAGAAPWLLSPLPGAALVRLVLFPGVMAVHMALSPPLALPDLAGVLFLFIATIGFSLARPPAPSVDFSPVEPRGELRGYVPVAFLAWSVGLVLLTWWSGARAAWILWTAIFCAAHHRSWRRLAQAGLPVPGPLATLVLGTLILVAFAAAWSWGGQPSPTAAVATTRPAMVDATRAAAVAMVLVWTMGVGRVRPRPAPSKKR